MSFTGFGITYLCEIEVGLDVELRQNFMIAGNGLSRKGKYEVVESNNILSF